MEEIDSSAWENQMNIGNYFGTKMVPGLLAHGYNSQFSDSVEVLLDMTPAGVSIIMGEPTDPSANGMYFNHINDFKGSGMGITGSQFTALFTTTLVPSVSGNYKFKMNSADDNAWTWFDFDQDGIFEMSGDLGSEKVGQANQEFGPQEFTSPDIYLTAGQEYNLGLISANYGGGGTFRPWIQVPGGSMEVMNPSSVSQQGLFNVPVLSNDQPQSTQISLDANLSALTPDTTYFYRVRATNSLGIDWSDASSSFFTFSPPTDLNSTAPLIIAENQPIGAVIGEFNSTDLNANATLTYELLDGFALIDTDTGSGGSITSSTSHASYPAYKAFDNDLTAAGRWLAEQSQLPNIFVRYDFGSPVKIDSYHITSQHIDFDQRSPKTWQLLGSNDDLNWSIVSSESNQTNWMAFEQRAYHVSNSGNFRFYKLVVSEATGSNDYLGIAEIEFFQEPQISSVFTLESNGTLKTATVFDFESKITTYSINVKVRDEHNASMTESFTVSITNAYEDTDGDGFSDQQEIEAGTLLNDPNSKPGLEFGLLGYWPLDGNASDMSGNGRDGTRHNGAAFQAGAVGQGLYFDGNNDAFTLPSFSMGGEMTISFWGKINQFQDWDTMMDFANGSNSQNLKINMDNSGASVREMIFQMKTPNGDRYLGEPFWVLNKWVHLALTVDKDATISLYRSGIFTGAVTGTDFADEISRSKHWFGKSTHSSNYTKGMIDEIRFYDRAILPEEALQIAMYGNTTPYDLNSTTPLNIPEGQAVGSVVGQFTAVDPDAWDSLSYLLFDNNGTTDNSFFTLESNGTLKSATTFDFENNKSTYTIQVLAKDDKNATTSDYFTVNLSRCDSKWWKHSQ